MTVLRHTFKNHSFVVKGVQRRCFSLKTALKGAYKWPHKVFKVYKVSDDDELMLNVRRCQLTY